MNRTFIAILAASFLALAGCGYSSDDEVIGYTEAPGQAEPAPLDKTISHCGDETMETGTTFFTDGTTGWTENCSAQMM